MDALLPNSRSWADRPRVPPVLEFLDGRDEAGVLGLVVLGGFDARSIRGGRSGTVVGSFMYFTGWECFGTCTLTWSVVTGSGAVVLYWRRRPG